MYCPVVQAVAGEATTPVDVAPAAFAGGVDPAGVQVPGLPAVAPTLKGVHPEVTHAAEEHSVVRWAVPER